MNILNNLEALCIFRSILSDCVIMSLCEYMSDPLVSSYTEFVSRLYDANGGDLSEYVKCLVENSCNVYVKTVGRGKSVPSYMHESLLRELDILTSLSDLTSDELIAYLSDAPILPKFDSHDVDLKNSYLGRINAINRYGYGIFAEHRMFCLSESGEITPVVNPDDITLSQLVDYERERGIILDNTRALLNGKPAANILLTGDAGTGKSSSIKAVVNELWCEGLRIVEIRKEQLCMIPNVLSELSENPLRFILFIDDISFLNDDDNFNALKRILEGSVTAKSKNVVVYATSNRRHIVRESFSEREGDDVHRNDTMQEMISLSERFGLHITFSKPGKDTYLHIVHKLADESGISIPDLDLAAERFALARGGRSARLARQFVDSLISSAES